MVIQSFYLALLWRIHQTKQNVFVDGISEITDEGNEVDVIYSDFLF
jgi:hypothetical protein